MKSMTGYGKCVVSEQTRSLTVEMKAVNNRYLEINVRLPKVLAPFENDVKTVIKSRLSRGSVDVFLTYASEAESHVAVDEAAARAYLDAAKTLSEKFTLVNDYSVTDLMKAPGVVAEEADDESEDELRDIVVRTTSGAVDALDKMRAKEGEGVTKNLRDLADNIDSALCKVIERAPLVVEEYREKLHARISEALAGVAIDEARLLNEVAIFADKADINEEIQRLGSHIAQYRAATEAYGPQGRNLDFISQEMGREINTMGSKSNDKTLTSLVIYMKNELEKIKEQIRNVE